MKLIIGLGNPGSKYELTRHNIGFQILDYLADYLKVKFKPSKGEWYGASGNYNGFEFYFMKPFTFMNNSGEAIFDFLTNNNIPLNNILVVYDDFQIPLGMIRLRTKGSDGGHNGIASIIYRLETMSFPRMRIGIGKDQLINKGDFVDFVLTKFSSDEIEAMKVMFPVYKDCILSFISGSLADTMNKYNRNFLKKEEEKVKKEDKKQDENPDENKN
ncbi:MAG: aminoacyl-tRNA hydrolase [Ignavibacteriae bacterium]|nr:aminoacyl-tRNA hydrolase [Ignavibacteriota bacterium]